MFRNLTYIVLGLSLLISSTGISVIEQLCQMRGRSVAVYIQPEDCTGQRPDHRNHANAGCCSTTHSVVGDHFSPPPCCNDEVRLNVEPVDGPPQPQLKLAHSGSLAVAILLFPKAFDTDAFPGNQKALQFRQHRPPPLITELHIQFQSFRC